MSSASSSPHGLPPADRPSDPFAALLSYLIPGLGQVYQGRIGKGILFFVCIYTLFLLGVYLGSGSIEIKRGEEGNSYNTKYTVSSNVYLPDTYEQNNPLNLPRLAANLYNRPQFAGQFWVGIAAWPAVWQYINSDRKPENDDSVFNFGRTPSEAALNAVHTSGDKLLELAWVFTVVAGVLNVMVIYDALAGPAFPPADTEEDKTTR